MTLIDSEAKRDELINIIFEIEATGGTCLGEGVRQGLEVSKQKIYYYKSTPSMIVKIYAFLHLPPVKFLWFKKLV